MPERFLLQILRSLVTHGILQSTRGVEGGYALTKAPDEISVLEIIEAIEGPMSSSFPTTDQLDEGARARLSTALSEVATTARRQLDAIKLSQLVQPEPFEPLETNG
jgi:Rrf2 family protein